MSPADIDQSEAELLKALLAERDLPCPVCGYNLRAIASTNCPECGAKLDLRVGSTDLKLGPWLVAVLSVGLPLGACALWSITIAIFMTIQNTWAAASVTGIITLGIASIPYAIAMAALIAKRRWFWKWSRTRQRVVTAIVGIGSSLVFVGLMAWLISL